MTQAAYGAAFGDAVGVALLNPTANGSTALLANEVQNALIDNAEGSYKPGIALSQEPPHIPLQGEALLIPNAGGGPFGPAIDWAFSGGPGAYAQFVAPAQIGPLQITNAPNNFTLNTQHFGTQDTQVIGHGQLFTLIVGDSIASDNLGLLQIQGYSTVHVVVANSPGTNIINTAFGSFSDMVVSGSGHLSLNQIEVPAIIDIGVSLATGLIQTYEIDASNAPVLVMGLPNLQEGVSTLPGVTVLGGTSGNVLQGSLDFFGAGGTTVTFSNGSTGFSSASGPDQFTGGPGGADEIFGLGGSDVITLPNHLLRDFIVFGQEQGVQNIVQAITDGNDVAHLGFWGTGGSATPIPALFGGGNTGGTSTDMTAITGFQAGPNGDVLDFTLGAWNGNSVQVGLGFATGDLVGLNGQLIVPIGVSQLSAVWVNNGSNASLKPSDTVLMYAPADASVQNAQQLATQLHTSSDAIVLPGHVIPGAHVHVLVAYDASFTLVGLVHHVVNIADVDLVNTGVSNQSSTANLNVYASDMVSLIGVSLTGLAAANVHFI